MKVVWSTLTKKYCNVPYKLGSYDINQGLDCLSLIHNFSNEIGKEVDFKNPDFKIEYKENQFNVAEGIDICKSNEELGEAAMLFIKKMFTKIERLKKGCICISEIWNMKFTSIYVGNGKHLMMFDKIGTRILPVTEEHILEIYE